MSKLGHIKKALETIVKDSIPNKRPKTMESSSPKMSESSPKMSDLGTGKIKKDYTLSEDGSYKMSDYV